MRYINSYQDVGPQIKQEPITFSDLTELAKSIDKKEIWVRSDQRLIFTDPDTQFVDEILEQLANII